MKNKKVIFGFLILILIIAVILVVYFALNSRIKSQVSEEERTHYFELLKPYPYISKLANFNNWYDLNVGELLKVVIFSDECQKELITQEEKDALNILYGADVYKTSMEEIETHFSKLFPGMTLSYFEVLTYTSEEEILIINGDYVYYNLPAEKLYAYVTDVTELDNGEKDIEIYEYYAEEGEELLQESSIPKKTIKKQYILTIKEENGQVQLIAKRDIGTERIEENEEGATLEDLTNAIDDGRDYESEKLNNEVPEDGIDWNTINVSG